MTFEKKKIIFRIIEVRKGLVNITFGYGKKIMFDHIGFFVSKEDQNEICKNANELNWKVDRGERRTFITTPYDFRIELQSFNDAIDSITDNTKIEELNLNVKLKGLEKDLSFLFSNSVNNVISEVNNEVTIKKAVIKGFPSTNIMDPNGVRIFNG